MAEHQRRRRTDGLKINVRENWYRDVWLLIISGLVVFAAFQLQVTSDKVQEGRRFGVSTSCAIESAVAAAGKQVIVGSTPQKDTPFFRRLEKLGYPSLAQRRQMAQTQGQAYVRSISVAIQSEVGAKGKHLVRSDGTLDCNAFERLSDVPGK